MKANYQPQKQTLTLVGSDNIPMSGFIGTIAEQKAKQLSEKGIPVFTIETKLYPSVEKIAEDILDLLANYWYDIDETDFRNGNNVSGDFEWGSVEFKTMFYYNLVGDNWNKPREPVFYHQDISELSIVFADETECDYIEEIEKLVNKELEKSF